MDDTDGREVETKESRCDYGVRCANCKGCKEFKECTA